MPLRLQGPTGAALASSPALTSTFVKPDAIVNATAGLGSHTDLAAAIAAAPTSGYILVTSDLTVSPGAGTTAFVPKAGQTIDFRAGPGATSRRIYNSGDGDVFGSGVAIGSNGQVNGVRILAPFITRTTGRSAGRAFNMHGTFHWVISDYQIAGHAVGVYMDASPYPSGQCSHNELRHGLITNCGTAVLNTGSANINTWFGLNISNCDVHIDHVSGLNPMFYGVRCENLNGVATPLIYARGTGLRIFGLHAEAQGSVGALTVETAARGVDISGDIYNTGAGTPYAIADGARYRIKLSDGLTKEHGTNRAQNVSIAHPNDITSTTSKNIWSAPLSARIKGVRILPDFNIGFSAGNYWTIQMAEYNGVTRVADIGPLYTQAAGLSMGPIVIASGIDYPIGQDRIVRVEFTKVGTATTFYAPIVQVEWDVA